MIRPRGLEFSGGVGLRWPTGLVAASLAAIVLAWGDPARAESPGADSLRVDSAPVPVSEPAGADPAVTPAVRAGSPSRSLDLPTAPSSPGRRPGGISPGAPAPLTPLNPDIAGAPFQLAPGPRQFLRRLSFSPGAGWLGDGRLYVFRLGFNPNPWLGYELSVGHAPGDAVHALVHGLSAQVRLPLPFRLQPYATFGYGMLLVFPGRLVNADAVTRNTLSAGGGVELYIRDDVALRSELRHRSVIGRDRNSPGNVTFDYREATIGLTFYRALGRRAPASTTTPGGSEP